MPKASAKRTRATSSSETSSKPSVGKKFKLTAATYFSKSRPHLSNSQLSDYLKSPSLFKARHLEGRYQIEPTDSMKRGLVADHLLTEPGVTCPYVLKVLKKDNPELYAAQQEMDQRYLVPQSYWDAALEVVDAVKKQPFWQEGLEQALFQQILEGKIENTLVCGKPDRIDPLPPNPKNNLPCYRIVDLKVVSPMKISSDAKWLYNALEMGYVRQAAMYRRLWAEKMGVPHENITFCHIAAAYVEPGFVQINLYVIPSTFMDEADVQIEDAVYKIEQKMFDDPPVTWASAHSLSHFRPASDEDEDAEEITL